MSEKVEHETTAQSEVTNLLYELTQLIQNGTNNASQLPNDEKLNALQTKVDAILQKPYTVGLEKSITNLQTALDTLRKLIAEKKAKDAEIFDF